MTTYMDCNTAEVATITVDIQNVIAQLTIPSGKGGRIKKIFFNAIAADSAGGYIEAKLGSHSGPFRFPIPYLLYEAGTAANAVAAKVEVDVDIEVFANETVEVSVTPTIAMTEGHAGILWEA